MGKFLLGLAVGVVALIFLGWLGVRGDLRSVPPPAQSSTQPRSYEENLRGTLGGELFSSVRDAPTANGLGIDLTLRAPLDPSQFGYVRDNMVAGVCASAKSRAYMAQGYVINLRTFQPDGTPIDSTPVTAANCQ